MHRPVGVFFVVVKSWILLYNGCKIRMNDNISFAADFSDDEKQGDYFEMLYSRNVMHCRVQRSRWILLYVEREN